MVFIKENCGFSLPEIVFFSILKKKKKKKKKNFFSKFFWRKYCWAITKSEWHTPKSKFGQFLAKMAKTVKIIKKALGTFFLTFWTLTSYKISEKSDERFPRKSVTDVRTYVRTHVRTDGHTDATPKVSNDQLVERPKIRQFRWTNLKKSGKT